MTSMLLVLLSACFLAIFALLYLILSLQRKVEKLQNEIIDLTETGYHTDEPDVTRGPPGGMW